MDQVAFTTLKVSKFDSSLTDREIYQEIFDKCHGFKEFNIKVITGNQGARLVYINFAKHEEASKCYKIRKRCLQTMRGMSLNVVPIMSKIQRENKEIVPSLLSASKRLSRIGIICERNKESVHGSKNRRSPIRPAKDAHIVKSPVQRKLLQKPFIKDPRSTSKYRNKANKNVYVGNLESSITGDDIQQIFEPYGFIEDIDIKMCNGVRMAFVKYFDLDMAIRGLREVRGKLIGSRIAQLGFGSVVQTRCIWIGGIGPWTDEVHLMRTFGEYGDIIRFEWPHDKPYAYVLFDTQVAATNAFENLQGLPLGPENKKIRLDYSTITNMDSKLNYQEFKFVGMERDDDWDGNEENKNENNRQKDDKPRSSDRQSSRRVASNLSADRKRRFSDNNQRNEDSRRVVKDIKDPSAEYEHATPPVLSSLSQLGQSQISPPSVSESNARLIESTDSEQKVECNDLRDVLKKRGSGLRGRLGYGFRGQVLGGRGRGINQKRSSGGRPTIGLEGDVGSLLQNRSSNEIEGAQNENMDFRISDRGGRDGSIPEGGMLNVRLQDLANSDWDSEHRRRSIEGDAFSRASGGMESNRTGRYSPRDDRITNIISREGRRSSDRKNQNDDMKINTGVRRVRGRSSNRLEINSGRTLNRGVIYLNQRNVGSVRGRVGSRELRRSSERRGGCSTAATSRMSSERNSAQNQWNNMSDNEDFRKNQSYDDNRFDNRGGRQDEPQRNYGILQEQEDHYSDLSNVNHLYSNMNNNFGQGVNSTEREQLIQGRGQYNLSPQRPLQRNNNNDVFRNSQEFSLRQSGNRSLEDFQTGRVRPDSRTNNNRPSSRGYQGSRDGERRKGGSNRHESRERMRSRDRGNNNYRGSGERHGSRHRHSNRSSGEHRGQSSRDSRRHQRSRERDNGSSRIRVSRERQTSKGRPRGSHNQRRSREPFVIGNRHGGGNRDSTDHHRMSRRSKSWDDFGTKRSRASRSPQRDDPSKRRRVSGNRSREFGPRTPSPNELMQRNQHEFQDSNNAISSYDGVQVQAGNITLSHLNPLYPEDEMQSTHGRIENQMPRYNPTVAPPAFSAPIPMYPDGPFNTANMFQQRPPIMHQPPINFGGMPPMSVGRFPMPVAYGNNAGALIPPPPVRIPPVVGMLGVNNEISKRFPAVWSGAMVLKNSAFVSSMYLVSGSVPLVDALLRDPSSPDCPVLKISQRLRLDEPQKLHELERRIASSGRNGCSVLLAAPAAAQVGDVNNVIQQRALLSLGVYLREKQCAAVIFLPPGCRDGEETGVMHAFPPCHFASEFLRKEAEELTPDYPKDDHLLIIVMRENLRS